MLVLLRHPPRLAPLFVLLHTYGNVLHYHTIKDIILFRDIALRGLSVNES